MTSPFTPTPPTPNKPPTRPSLAAIVALIAAFSLLLLAACDLSSVPTPVPTPDPLAEALAQLPNADSFNIRDDWAGLALTSPILAHYRLERAPSGMTGVAEFSAGQQPITATEAITVPKDVIDSFLSKLASAPLKAGDYTPDISHTDDYPNLSITIQVTSGIVSYYSQSQGEDHLPWGASIGNTVYTIDTKTISEALALLKPYLKEEVRQQVIDRASHP